MMDVKPNSSQNKFRLRRINQLKQLIEKTKLEKDQCSVLDVGGTHRFWHAWGDHIDWSGTTITCINLNPSHAAKVKDERIRVVQGNACHLVNVKDHEYDVVFSNSVIEHVGSWLQMEVMAKEVKRVGRRYLVQTPNFWFPIEPHARTPLLHWLPEPIAYRIVMSRNCGFWKRQHTVSGAVQTVQSAHLLDFKQMQTLFEDAVVMREKFFGMTKALIAIKE